MNLDIATRITGVHTKLDSSKGRSGVMSDIHNRSGGGVLYLLLHLLPESVMIRRLVRKRLAQEYQDDVLKLDAGR